MSKCPNVNYYNPGKKSPSKSPNVNYYNPSKSPKFNPIESPNSTNVNYYNL